MKIFPRSFLYVAVGFVVAVTNVSAADHKVETDGCAAAQETLSAFVGLIHANLTKLYEVCPVYDRGCLEHGGAGLTADDIIYSEKTENFAPECVKAFESTSFGAAFVEFGRCTRAVGAGRVRITRWHGEFYDEPGCVAQVKKFLQQSPPAARRAKPKTTDLPFVHASRSDFTFDYEIRDDRGQFCEEPGNFFMRGTAAPGDVFYVPCDGSNTGGFCMREKEHFGQKEFGEWHGGYLCGHQKNGGRYEW